MTTTTKSPIVREEFAGAILGVKGRFFGATIGGKNYKPGTFTSQKFVTESRPFKSYGARALIKAKIRFDDNCRNGHNTFAITGEIYIPGARDCEACGCIHDDLAKAFPELDPMIKWHLTSSDSPMHYIANAVYHASNRDHRGKAAGEPYAFAEAIQFGDNPIKHKVKSAFWRFLKDAAPHNGRDAFDFEVLPFYHDDQGKPGKYQFGPKFTFGGFADKWHECPFDTESDALDFLKALQTCAPKFVQIPTLFSEGKSRDLDAARAAAVWPDATDAELMVSKEELTAALQARQPALVKEFRDAMESTGFLWAPEAE